VTVFYNIIHLPEATPLENALLEKLTIAVPVYNDAQYIRRTVESCLGQAGQILIYDNASTDGTGEICAALAAQHASVRHIRHDENIGAFENFRKSLFDCETEYFCWIGSHDLIAPGYSLPILRCMEENRAIATGTGTITYIDEKDRKTGKVAKTLWASETAGKPAVDRAGLCATKIKDCFLFYGIHRTAAAQAAWSGQPCLGFDRAFLCRMAAAGEIFYQPESTFLARDFITDRKNEDTTARRLRDIGKRNDAPLPKEMVHRNKSMAQTILDQAGNDTELRRALRYIAAIDRRYVSRRKHQKQRLICVLLAALALAFALAAPLGRCLF
jgi:glycosyltransferase involved in cell wall biosynthesis